MLSDLPSGIRNSDTIVHSIFVSHAWDSPADRQGVEGLSVRHWSRHGKERLYVNDPTGKALGWADLSTGTVQVGQERHRPMVMAALEAHTAWPVRPRSSPENPAAGPDAERRPEQSQPSVEEPWTDLALNQPGQAARAQAVALRRQAPVKTAISRLFNAKTDERA